jgi:hypothetical protein
MIPIRFLPQRLNAAEPQPKAKTFPRITRMNADVGTEPDWAGISASIREIRGKDRSHGREFLPACEDFGLQ